MVAVVHVYSDSVETAQDRHNSPLPRDVHSKSRGKAVGEGGAGRWLYGPPLSHPPPTF